MIVPYSASSGLFNIREWFDRHWSPSNGHEVDAVAIAMLIWDVVPKMRTIY